ncbi:hypothetical protein G5I_14533 [Acromyrmex echinatior]|uniref:Uncharacterized protein n=1 Tax=Acromyrmex echinatior TaxID=103372 RepID=F4X7X8_ACREC|nr:hypothetical protein G5I_14533 [Acromyrmex echinatior]
MGERTLDINAQISVYFEMVGRIELTLSHLIRLCVVKSQYLTSPAILGGANMMSLLFMHWDASQICLHIAMIEVVDLVGVCHVRKKLDLASLRYACILKWYYRFDYLAPMIRKCNVRYREYRESRIKVQLLRIFQSSVTICRFDKIALFLVINLLNLERTAKRAPQCFFFLNKSHFLQRKFYLKSAYIGNNANRYFDGASRDKKRLAETQFETKWRHVISCFLRRRLYPSTSRRNDYLRSSAHLRSHTENLVTNYLCLEDTTSHDRVKLSCRRKYKFLHKSSLKHMSHVARAVEIAKNQLSMLTSNQIQKMFTGLLPTESKVPHYFASITGLALLLLSVSTESNIECLVLYPQGGASPCLLRSVDAAIVVAMHKAAAMRRVRVKCIVAANLLDSSQFFNWSIVLETERESCPDDLRVAELRGCRYATAACPIFSWRARTLDNRDIET